MPSHVRRFVTLLVAAIQFAAPATASVAEGRSARRLVDPKVHVEEFGQKDCASPHAADCALCRYLANGASGSEMAGLPPLLEIAGSLAIGKVRLHSSVAANGFEARGPPATAG